MPETINWDKILQEAIEESNRKDNLKTKIAKWVATAIVISAAAVNALFLWKEVFSKW